MLLNSLKLSVTASYCHFMGPSAQEPSGWTAVQPGMPRLKSSWKRRVAGAAWSVEGMAREAMVNDVAKCWLRFMVLG